ncbi:MAG: hypothetical protein R3B09_27780 [Nannocystaceae bacterium]
MVTLTRTLGLAGLLVLGLAGPTLAAAAPAPTRPSPAAEPASSYVGHLFGSPNAQAAEVDLGVITGVRYIASSGNQSVAISSTSGGKNHLCFLQFNSISMKDRPGWTRAEPLEVFHEVLAAARTPGGKILCVGAFQGGSPGSIARVLYNGTFLWLVFGDSNAPEFQIILP